MSATLSVLAPTDGSPAAEEAVPRVGDLLRREGARVTIRTLTPPPELAVDAGGA